MEGKLQTSFIPKSQLAKNKTNTTRVTFGIFGIIGWFIFLVVILGSVGVYLYEEFYLVKTIEAKNLELNEKVKNFPVDDIVAFEKLEARLQTANTLLSNHLAVSTLLNLIAENTIVSVQFTNMAYTYDDSGKLSLSLSGKAKNFESVALQSDTFSSKVYLQNQIFSGLALDQDGWVSFKFSATVDQSALKYKSVN